MTGTHEMDLDNSSLATLLSRYSAARSELESIASALKERGISRTGSIVGELGERLALSMYGGALTPASTAGIDLISADGRRIQVKTRALPSGELRVYDFSTVDVDVAICLRFDVATFALDWAREFDRKSLFENARPHGAGYRMTGARALSTGYDVTERFRAAWEELQVRFA